MGTRDASLRISGTTLMGSGPKQTQTTNQQTIPWAAQQPYLLDAWKRAQDTLNSTTAKGPYQGDFVAAPSQDQYNAYSNALSRGYGQQGTVDAMGQAGQANLQTGTGALSGAAGALGAFGMTDPTAGNIAKARQYAAGLDIPGAVDAAMFNATRDASENAVPSIYRAAAKSGGINSDRTAIMEGVVNRGLAEQRAGLYANLANDAYKTGLSNAQQGNAQNLQALAQLGAVGNEASKTGYLNAQGELTGQQNINAQLAGAANGANALDQAILNNLMQKYQADTGFDWSQLNNYMGIVGDVKGTHTTGTTTTKTSPSLMQNIGSGIGIMSALFCDRRIKNVYAQVGEWMPGIPAYLFSYKGVEGLHRGPMAQDVEAVRPDAVTEMFGIKVILLNKL